MHTRYIVCTKRQEWRLGNSRLLSVNNYTDKGAVKFNYKTVDSVVDYLEENDYMAVINMANVYKAVPIHPNYRIRQGLSWQFSSNILGHSFLVDNRL